MLDIISKYNEDGTFHKKISVRIGLTLGPVVAGVIGQDRLQYDIFGSPVIEAQVMEEEGEPDRIQVSEIFMNTLKVCHAE